MTVSLRSLLSLAIVAALAGCNSSQSPAPAPAPAPEPQAAPASAVVEQPAADPLSAALSGAHRSDENRARDAWRHPQETLAFFGFRPDLTVVEVTPGGGWYTEVLAPALRGSGRLVAAVIDPASAANERSRDYYTRGNEAFRAKLDANPEVYDQVVVTPFSMSEPVFGEPGSVDLVLTFRNVHNWVGAGAAPGMFKGFYDALRPGGVLGVVEHRAQPGSKAAEDAGSGYMTEDAIIALATAAGFELAGKSEVNANPADSTDHPNGVWTLAPSLRVPEGEDAEKYKAIGESDRMTLRFVKPRADEIKRTSMD
ncbi:class I SAM-dependent methyltransferase [Pseudofulvimonas gallinarii]|uniref:Putative methyltransferase n=1 Tax=Pseudofulvimonas gallinarii TaxID=634155 RepID=A0A4R3LH38_9GAMM|nr:class I SAM-dependent methyltransferase [Pseudofulvimonas gallinarii]TCS98890.1 putative methyltransferase [Pseudofulvimonas gallinarii]THD14369.1 hypothetical protein B1808_03660 [Pseudofulvimonas gallinarii]